MSGGRVLVTGAEGFIGSHLCEALVRRNYEVRAFVWYNAFNSWGWLEDCEPAIKDSLDVFMGDVRDPDSTRAAIRDCDKVVHLAALIGVPYSYHSPSSYVETNVTGTLNLLTASRDAGLSKFIQTSTSEVYGTAQVVPITEDHPLNAQSPYAATKIAADQLALSFHRSFGSPVGILRPFNAYGPRQSTRAVLPTIMMQILSDRQQVRLGSVHPTRDFNYVDDIVEVFICTLESDAVIGEVINVGSGFEVSIGDAAKIVAGALGTSIEITCDASRVRPKASEVERLWADNSKARSILGWTPKYGGRGGFENGIAKTVAWYREHGRFADGKVDQHTL